MENLSFLNKNVSLTNIFFILDLKRKEYGISEVRKNSILTRIYKKQKTNLSKFSFKTKLLNFFEEIKNIFKIKNFTIKNLEVFILEIEKMELLDKQEKESLEIIKFIFIELKYYLEFFQVDEFNI
jgi:hypothetical protein